MMKNTSECWHIHLILISNTPPQIGVYMSYTPSLLQIDSF